MKNTIYTYYLVIISIFFGVSACNSTDPKIEEVPKLTLTLEEVTCTEAWITLSIDSFAVNTEVVLEKADTVFAEYTLTEPSVVIYDSLLLPNQSYVYKAYLKNNEKLESEELLVTALDTTSSNFTWEIYEFGEHGSSILRDVAIIEGENGETNIWAVGTIFLNDSTGAEDPVLFNSLQWDGSKWVVKRISLEFRGNQISPAMEGIHAFASDDLWFTSGVPAYWDGNKWLQYHLFDMGILNETDGGVVSIWGSSPTDIYFVGRKGSIAHYNGTGWRKVESPIGTGGTEVDLRDIYGDNNSDRLLVVGYEDDWSRSVLLEKKGNGFSTIWEGSSGDASYLGGLLASVYVNGSLAYLTAGSRLFRINLNNYKVRVTLKNAGSFIHKLRGTGNNDIIAAGEFGKVFHFNGVIWKRVSELEDNNSYFYSAAVTDDLVVLTGQKDYDILNRKAIVVIGRR